MVRLVLITRLRPLTLCIEAVLLLDEIEKAHRVRIFLTYGTSGLLTKSIGRHHDLTPNPR